jgi:hypothetical protein
VDNGCLDPAQLGGRCEDPPGYVPSACGAGVTETAICLKTLSDIFASKCAATGQLIPCLCGTTDETACLSGAATPTGPVYPDYACDFPPGPGLLRTDFYVPLFGAGRANAIVACAQNSGCNCF